jgi:hypothetical protein
MNIALHTPEGYLGRYVNLMVYHEGYDPPHAVERFLPDGSVDLVIDLKDDPKHVYDNDDLSVRQSCRNAWFSGIRTAFISISSGMDSSMLVVNFKPHGAFDPSAGRVADSRSYSPHPGIRNAPIRVE